MLKKLIEYYKIQYVLNTMLYEVNFGAGDEIFCLLLIFHLSNVFTLSSESDERNNF